MSRVVPTVMTNDSEKEEETEGEEDFEEMMEVQEVTATPKAATTIAPAPAASLRHRFQRLQHSHPTKYATQTLSRGSKLTLTLLYSQHKGLLLVAVSPHLRLLNLPFLYRKCTSLLGHPLL